MLNVSVINYPNLGVFKIAADDMALNPYKRTVAYFWLPLSKKDRPGFEGRFACPTQGQSSDWYPRLGTCLSRVWAGSQAGVCTLPMPLSRALWCPAVSGQTPSLGSTLGKTPQPSIETGTQRRTAG